MTERPSTERPGPDLSVVVPVHNGQATVGHAVASVLAQTGPTLEVVVVDDGSDDGSAAAAATTGDPRVRVLRQDRAGVAAARNAGVAASRALLVGFLDADDEVLPGWADALVAAAAPSGVGLASCGLRRLAQDGTVSDLAPRPLGPAFGGVTASFLAGAFVVRRALLDEAGGYRPELRFGENFELGLRLSAVLVAHGLTAAALPQPLAVWHDRADRAHPPAAVLGSAELMLRLHAGAMGRDRRLRADHHAVAGVNAARLGELRRARHHLLAAARDQPSWRAAARLATVLVPPLARRAWPPTPSQG